MWGRDYIVTVQAINNNHKMSLVSEPSIFSVDDPLKSKLANTLPPPIIQLQADVATPSIIDLSWTEIADAKDYKLMWDRGDHSSAS